MLAASRRAWRLLVLVLVAGVLAALAVDALGGGPVLRGLSSGLAIALTSTALHRAGTRRRGR